MYRSSSFKDNRGLSLLELIVVIAIMAVLIGAAGFGLSLLVGTEARQAVYKMEAQLNDTKTGTLTKAGEDLVVRYIDVSSNVDDWALKGVDKSGYYADKCLYTIVMNAPGSNMKQQYSDKHEYSYIGAKKVNIDVFLSSGQTKIDSSNAIRIRFKRDSGEIEDVEVGSVNAADEFTASSSGKIDRIEFTAGLRKYVIKFTPLTGQFSISTS
ncbi:MAG: prepilin-type N-terminal cleavage/methylation domain-containing protein [Lachnospiraceae bacterium]|nr:prepilin-type N-terminal cleavage/methylation domain-containing protein [Lachnospiraceae bacterium]